MQASVSLLLITMWLLLLLFFLELYVSLCLSSSWSYMSFRVYLLLGLICQFVSYSTSFWTHMSVRVYLLLGIICQFVAIFFLELYGSLCLLMLLLSFADCSQIKHFQKNSFRNTIRVSNGLDLDQGLRLSVLIWAQTVCQSYQQTTKGTASKESVNGYKICLDTAVPRD